MPPGRLEGTLAGSFVREEEGIRALTFDLEGRLGLGRGFSTALTVPFVYAPDVEDVSGVAAISLVGRYARRFPLGRGGLVGGGGLGMSIPASSGERLPPGDLGFTTGSLDPLIEVGAGYDHDAGPGAFCAFLARPVFYDGRNDVREGSTTLLAAGPRWTFFRRLGVQAALLWMHRTERPEAVAGDWFFATPRVSLRLGRFEPFAAARLPIDQPDDVSPGLRTRFAVTLGLSVGGQAFGEVAAPAHAH